MNNVKQWVAIVLIILGVVMIVLGIRGNILPPSITGAGFILIAIAFLADKKAK